MKRFFRLLMVGATAAIVIMAAYLVAPQFTKTVAVLRLLTGAVVAQSNNLPTQEYVVQPGDTPFGVALTYQTTVEALIVLNADRYPEMGLVPMKFNAGWRILVPATLNAVSTSGGSKVEVIQSSISVADDTPVVSDNGPVSGSFDYDGALTLIQLTNDERARIGLAPLTVDEGLMEIARKRAVEIVTDWGHQGLDDDCPQCGENLIQGGDVLGEFQWWMNSDGHRGGLLWADYSVSGVGRFIINGKAYAVQLFK